MKTIEDIMSYHLSGSSKEEDGGYVSWEDVKSMMKQYAVEAINELVDEMLAYPPNELSESANLIQIANKIKRQIHGVTDKTV